MQAVHELVMSFKGSTGLFSQIFKILFLEINKLSNNYKIMWFERPFPRDIAN